MRPIDAQRLVDILLASHDEVLNQEVLPRVEKIISEISTVDLVKHGYWIRVKENSLHSWECSVCKQISLLRSIYCPKCGAKMDKVIK